MFVNLICYLACSVIAVSGTFYYGQRDTIVDIDKAFHDSKIVPDIIDTSPKELVKVTYPGNISIELGNEITPAQSNTKPHLTWTAKQSGYYTIAMVDPDASTRSINHWLVMNVPGGQVSGGHIVTGYSGPHPPEGTGLHRYVVLIYQQPGLHINPPPRDDEHRRSFSIKDFAKNYTLGEPVLGNYFLAQH